MARPRNTMHDFWENVHDGGVTECWPWLGRGRSSIGYGRLKFGGRMLSAHRIAYAYAFGAVSPEQIVRHKCDNPGCCNPAHMCVGTHADNVADKVSRQRQARGERSARAKLSQRDALAIRNSVGKSSELATQYGVTRRTIAAIRSCSSWAWL